MAGFGYGGMAPPALNRRRKVLRCKALRRDCHSGRLIARISNRRKSLRWKDLRRGGTAKTYAILAGGGVGKLPSQNAALKTSGLCDDYSTEGGDMRRYYAPLAVEGVGTQRTITYKGWGGRGGGVVTCYGARD